MRRAAHPPALPTRCFVSSAVLLLGTWPLVAAAQKPPPAPASAASKSTQTLTIDLASEQAPTAQISVSDGTTKIRIQNLAPRYLEDARAAGPYDISVLQQTTPVPPLEYTVTPPLPPEASRTLQALDCAQLEQALLDATDEPTAAILIQENKKVLESCPTAQALQGTMTREYNEITLRRGDVLVVTIKRGVGTLHRVIVRRFVAPPAQTFLVTYGFNFIPKNDDEYYAKPSSPPTAGPQSYELAKKTSPSGFDYAPSVFFSYPFPFKKGHPLAWSPAAGLGFDLSSPVVFLGLALIFNQNIHLVGGGVMHQEARLRGEYTVPQPLTENLSNDQLTEKSYQPSWFVGLSFRFSSNPFSSSTAQKAVPVTSPDPSTAPASRQAPAQAPAATE